MKVKIKVKPEDFIVEETADFTLKKEALFGVYLLKKRGWNTVDLLLRLSQRLNIPFKNFSYGGRKDRYALTTQYITIQDPRNLSLTEESYSLQFIGFMARPMGPDLIRVNKFHITVRKLNVGELNKALKEIETVRLIGYPNYFDDQRFGNLDLKQGFLAEKIIKGHFNGALKIYLTSCYPEDKNPEKKRKRLFLENWKKWRVCLENGKTKFEKLAFISLINKSNIFLPILKKIPKEEMSLFIASYQSYIWNEVLRRIIQHVAFQAVRVYPGVAGDYIFYSHLKDNDYLYLRNLNLPTPASKAKMPDNFSQSIYEDVFKNAGITPAMFNKIKIRQAYFKSFPRQAITIPQNLSFSFSDDEMYKNKKKLSLEFSLPRGSFGTMFVKRLFSNSEASPTV